MSLRPYQQKAVEEALHALARSGSAVLQMPTGAGKTKAATEIIANHGGIVWFVCHRREIERQAARAFREAGIEFGIVSPRSKPDYSKRVQIVLVGTLARRVADLPAPSLVIWDECHHVAAKSWAEIREALTDALHLGLTATPERFDGKGLREWFAELIPGPSIPDLIPEFLSTYSYFSPSSPDLTAARMQAGDYAKGDAAKIMNTPVLIGDAFREYREKADGKRALAFCVTREASKALVERFQAEGVPAVHIDANTKDDEREAAVDDLVAGRIKLISNVEVFTEGVDIPEIDAVILLRPTKSPTLFFQMVGRVLRKAEGKAGAVILDHAGLVEDHGRLNDPWTWSIDGGAAKARRKASAGFRKCPKCKFCPQEREPVCSACGYEYPTGREVGEFDGILREIRGEVPEGCVTVKEFAAIVGVHTSLVCRWAKRGLPRNGVFVIRHAALSWVSDCIGDDEAKRLRSRVGRMSASSSGDFAMVSAYADRLGVSTEVVRRWTLKGLPLDSRGLVVVDAADEWVSQTVDIDQIRRRGRARRGDSNHSNYTDFGKRHGIGLNSVKTLVKQGLPVNNGLINVSIGDKWVEENKATIERLKSLSARRMSAPPPGYASQHTVAQDLGLSSGTIYNWIKNGYVETWNGMVDVVSARKYHLAYLANRRIGTNHFSAIGRTTVVGLARLIEKSGSTVDRMIKHGLPYDPKLGIPIREALEWVRDNRPDIVIPPEAWPSPAEPADNDNTATTKAA